MNRRELLTKGAAGMLGLACSAPLSAQDKGDRVTQANQGTVILDGCNWNPRDVTEIGCMEGALRFLGVDVSAAWLAGGIGYAFFPYIPGNCGGDPAYWTHEQYRGRLNNIGCRVTAFLSDQDGQKEDVVEAIRKGRPCVFFSWEAGEYVLLKGVKPDGMVLSFCGGNEAARPWKELAGAYSMRVGQAAPPAKVVQEALGLALQFSDGTKALTDFDAYYGCWKQLLDAGKTFGWGMSLTARRMAELRRSAPLFLREAASRLDGEIAGLLGGAASTYESASTAWEQLASLIPFPNRTTEQRQAYTTDPATVKQIRPVIDTIVEHLLRNMRVSCVTAMTLRVDPV
jgi:hypothetical protein